MATSIQEFDSSDFAPDRTAQALLNLRCAVDHCHDVIFIADSSSRIEFVNAAFEELTGYSASEAKQGGLSLIVEGNGAADLGKAMLGQALDKGFYRGELRIVRKDGRRIRLDLAMTVVRDYRTPAASVVCTGRDITDETELQAELRDARRMDTIGTVASGVAHDFNNLLMVISAYAELGLQTLYREHPLRRNLHEILAAAQRAAGLARQLLASGRSQVPGVNTVKLNSVIEESCRLLPQVLGEDIELRVLLGEDVGSIKADPGQIERVLLNLAVNARDAMPEGGTLSIKTQLAGLKGNGVAGHARSDSSEYLLLEVADSGVGIPVEQIPNIFHPFYTTKTEHNGNGLGLAIVERTVKESGGFITVDSEPGKGTAFRIYFPMSGHDSEAGEHSQPTENGMPRGSETVLVVEDDDAVRECSVDFLTSIGYKVLPAANGEEAVALATRHAQKIDVMISDVVMPHINGTKLAAVLAESQPDMKVLFVSGHGEDVVRRKGIEASTNFLQKPYPFGLLATKLRETLKPAVQAKSATAAAR